MSFVGLTTIPLVDALVDGPGAPPSGSVYLYTHFVEDTFSALAFIATNGDRCWRAQGKKRERDRGRMRLEQPHTPPLASFSPFIQSQRNRRPPTPQPTG
jgi:hypothetical protein